MAELKIPMTEPERQLYFIELCKEIIAKKSKEAGRSLKAVVCNYGCPCISAKSIL